MHTSHFRIIATLTGAFALSGCLTTEETEPGGLPPASNELPLTHTVGSTETGIDEYLSSGGTWKVNIDGQVQTKSFGSVSLLDTMVYDSDLNEWTVNIDGSNFVLTDEFLSGLYNSSGCPSLTGSCTLFYAYDEPTLKDQYGTFAIVGYANTNDTNGAVVVIHYGLKTSDMPVNVTGTYTGVFGGSVYLAGDIPENDVIEPLAGSVTIDADFSDAGASLTFNSSGIDDLTGNSYTLVGAADISGNTYQGTLTESTYTIGTTTTVIDPTDSTLSGAFYGPAAVETAGVVYSGGAGAEIVGGFWATQ